MDFGLILCTKGDSGLPTQPLSIIKILKRLINDISSLRSNSASLFWLQNVQCTVYMSTKILKNIPKIFLNVPMQRLAQPWSVHKFLPKFDNPASLSSKFSSFTLFCKSCPCSSAWSPNHTEQSPGRVTLSPWPRCSRHLHTSATRPPVLEQ